MHKLLLMSILFATAVIPAVAARNAHARRGLSRTLIGVVIFNFLYMLAVIFIYPQICW